MKNRTSIALENINRDLGKELAEKRYNAGLTQTQVIDELERREKEALVYLGLSEEEAEACIYAEGEELSPELKRKLRKAGIKKSYVRKTIAYISNCEAGKAEIPAALYKLLLEIYGE